MPKLIKAEQELFKMWMFVYSSGISPEHQ